MRIMKFRSESKQKLLDEERPLLEGKQKFWQI